MLFNLNPPKYSPRLATPEISVVPLADDINPVLTTGTIERGKPREATFLKKLDLQAQEQVTYTPLTLKYGGLGHLILRCNQQALFYLLPDH